MPNPKLPQLLQHEAIGAVYNDRYYFALVWDKSTGICMDYIDRTFTAAYLFGLGGDFVRRSGCVRKSKWLCPIAIPENGNHKMCAFANAT